MAHLLKHISAFSILRHMELGYFSCFKVGGTNMHIKKGASTEVVEGKVDHSAPHACYSFNKISIDLWFP